MTALRFSSGDAFESKSESAAISLTGTAGIAARFLLDLDLQLPPEVEVDLPAAVLLGDATLEGADVEVGLPLSALEEGEEEEGEEEFVEPEPVPDATNLATAGPGNL